jgi:alkylated DNA repair protein (DNA oxidative demethylase)
MAGMRGVEECPSGLMYRQEVVSPEEEQTLLQTLRHLDFDPVVMRGQPARRTVRHFGFTYDFDSWGVARTDPIPNYLAELRGSCAEMAGIDPASFEQALVTRYPVGATIGWHRDARAFGTVVGGVSLGSDCVMRFQRRAAGGERRVFEQPLARCSAYVLSGAARWAWQHSIPAVAQERYSITFRTLSGVDGGS